MLPNSQNVTKVYYLLYLHYVGMVRKHPKIDIFATLNQYFGSLSAHLRFLECHNAHTELPRSQDASFPGTWYQPTWLLGTWHLAVWSNTPSRARPSGHSGWFSLDGGECFQSPKIINFWHFVTKIDFRRLQTPLKQLIHGLNRFCHVCSRKCLYNSVWERKKTKKLQKTWRNIEDFR